MGHALQAKGITKHYGGVLANDGVSMSVPAGSIHALVGENGAGKSTLCKTLFGLVKPDAGEVLIHDVAVKLAGPGHAMELGVGMVHQHFMLVPTLSVCENVALGTEPIRGGMLDIAKARDDVIAMSQKFGLHVDPDVPVDDLPVGVQQRVEILKVLHRGARTLILDEPTAVLTPPEVEALFGVLRALKAEGRTVVLVTHKLPEVLSLCDDVTVMRAGKTVAERPLTGTTVDELATLMVGRHVDLERKKRTSSAGDVRLMLSQLEVTRADGRVVVSGVSLRVHAGEVVGIAGVEGNGQTELMDAVTGVMPSSSGQVILMGHDVTRQGVQQRKQLGLAHVPEDRLTQGLVPSMSVIDNSALGREGRAPFSRMGWLNRPGMTSLAEKLIGAFDIRPANGAQKVIALSGGNQQKIVVGRELSDGPKILLLSQPTRGVDVGAIERIHQAILEARDAGMAVLLVSAELTELIALSDVVHVMYRGQLVHHTPGDDATPQLLAPYMLGRSAA